MAECFSKTDSGRIELGKRAHALSRTARNLLFVIDPTREGDEWLALVQGASAADLHALLDAGLIAPAAAASRPAPLTTRPAELAPPPPMPRAAPASVPPTSVPPTGGALTQSEMYSVLPALAKQHLGLIKGLRFALAIEKAADLPALQHLAADLVSEVERSKGAAAALSLRRTLRME